MTVRQNVALAPMTTLELGGPARFFVEASGDDDLQAALEFAGQRSLPAFVLGGGSNLVVPDAGFDGLVIRMASAGVSFRSEGDAVLCEVAAGEPWDQVVSAAVGRDLAGLECLSGIPGSAGATPIQNVGAYGQEVADTVRGVRVLERGTGAIVTLDAAACGFAYRDSAFKRDPGRHVVLGVSFALRPGGAPTVRYTELAAALASSPAAPSLAQVRATVLELRRRKSMVIVADDPNRRSVGSFFTNPVLAPAAAEAVVARALAAGVVDDPAKLPRYPAAGGQVKLAAGWLIERSGMTRGLRRGTVGISSAHALALVHHGGGRTADLLALAREVRAAVDDRFGVWLAPEPVILGAPADDPLRIG
jgi:UDP-N-acetylmuramate dehydrogenase